MPGAQDPYNAFAYPGYSYPNTHPDRLALMGILHGLAPAPVESCRLLEVACGDGANLIPMAYTIPTSEFVGFDRAQLPIVRGQERIRELGLTNVRLFQGDLLNVGRELGQFDYLIAHGVYSWVPGPARDRLFGLVGEVLAPGGIAFVSYNALPGSYLRRMMREMMLLRVQDIEDPRQRVAAGMEFLHFLVETRPETDAYRTLFATQLKRMEGHDSATTFHDELSPEFHPVYLPEFVGCAQRHDLQYLCEAELPLPHDPCYRRDLRSALENAVGDDVLKQELALDFMRMRAYRETLLCRAGQTVRRDFRAEHFHELLAASQATPCDGETPGSSAFELPDGIKMQSNHPGVVRLLGELAKVWPRALRVDEIAPLLTGAGAALDAAGAELLTRLAVSRMIELRSWNAPVAGRLSERPRASACSRQEGRRGTVAATLLHTTIKLEDPKVRALLALLDGTRDRGALAAAMKAEFPSTPASEIEEGLEAGLEFLRRAGVLEA